MNKHSCTKIPPTASIEEINYTFQLSIGTATSAVKYCPYCGSRLAKYPGYEELMKLRKKSNLTIAQLSKRTGLSSSYLSDLEHGRRPISDRTIGLYTKEIK